MATRKYLFFTAEEGQRVPRLGIRSWGFVVVIGTLLAVIAIIDRGGVTTSAAAATGSCRFTVNTAPLNVRAEPTITATQVEQLGSGAEVAATNIITGGFRKIADGEWVLNEYLTPVPGATCT